MSVAQAKKLVEELPVKQRDEIQTLLIRGRDYLYIARKLKISATTVRNFDTIVNLRRVVSNDGYGKPELRKFIISRRYIDSPWPVEDSERIEKVQKEYDEGKVDMITGRDGFYQMLYRIPRQIIDKKRKPYFRKDEYVE